MGRKNWKRFGRRRGPRMATAWYDYNLVCGGQTTSDGMTILCGANSLAPLSTTGLDWGRKEWLLLVRAILKFLLVLTSTGTENYVQVLYGLRITELDQDGSLRTTADNPSLLNADDDSRRVDWLYRDSTVVVVPATSGSDVPTNVSRELVIDTKCNRSLPPNTGVVFHYRAVLLNAPSTNCDATQTGLVEGRLLLGRKRAI